MSQRKVLITGATGRIGSFLAEHVADRYDLTLVDRRASDNLSDRRFIQADIADLDAMCKVTEGIDTVVHLAADPSTRAGWDSLLPNNIVGVYNVFEAAHRAQCRRVVFASTINVVGGYPDELQVHTSMPVRPGNLYGASKAWGEAAGCFYADQLGLSVICLRFGWVADRNSPQLKPENPHLHAVLTYEDLTRLVVASIEAPDDLRFGIFHGLSNNRAKRLDISDARRVLGYEPQDDSFSLAGLPGPQRD